MFILILLRQQSFSEIAAEETQAKLATIINELPHHVNRAFGKEESRRAIEAYR